MTDDHSPHRSALQRYQSTWSDGLRIALAPLLGPQGCVSPIHTPQLDPSLFAAPDAGLWIRFAATGLLSGDQALFIPAEDLATVSLLDASATSSPNANPKRPLVCSLLAQAAEAVAAVLTARLGANVSFTSFPENAGTPFSPASLLAFRLFPQAGKPFAIYLLLSPALEASLLQTASQPSANFAQEPPSSRSPHALTQLEGGTMIDRLLDSELELTLCFGERHLLLRDILELASGSVVELDRHVDDPVELKIGAKTIARGQVVVVDGNYGLRITEMVGPQPRTNTNMN